MSSLGAFPLAIEFTTMKSSPCVISLDEDSFIAPGGGGGALLYIRKLRENKYMVHFKVASYKL